MHQNSIEALLDRYLNGETSKEENALVEKWLEENNNGHSQWQYLNQSDKDEWLAGVFGKIQHSIKASETKVVVMQPRKHLWRRIAAVAAVLLICFILYRQWPALQSARTPMNLLH